MKILVLCTGNSCRSQMAHGFLQSFDKKLQVFSAGTEPAEKINPTAVKIMSEIDVDISLYTPKLVTQYINEEWDFVITVCGDANENCPAFFGKVKTRLHIGFDDPSKAKGTDEFIQSEFYRVRNEISDTFLELYNKQIKTK